MKGRVLLIALFAMLPPTTWAETLYLTCKPISSPQLKPAEVYASPPKNVHDQFLTDLIMVGMIGWWVPPPETWIVDTDARTIHSPDHPEQFSFSGAEISQGKIHASAAGKNFDLNRVNGGLEYSKYLDRTEIDQWHKKHGGTLPSDAKWTYSCKSSKQPAV